MEEELIGAQPVDANVVISENIITSKGPGTAMDFGLTIIEYIKGTQKAEEIAAELLYSAQRTEGAL